VHAGVATETRSRVTCAAKEKCTVARVSTLRMTTRPKRKGRIDLRDLGVDLGRP